MSENAIFLTANWLGLGSGPLLLSVLSGTAVVLRADDTPAISRADGTVLASTIGAAPVQLAASVGWWIKALVANTAITVTPVAAGASSGGGTAVPTAAPDAVAVAGADLPAFAVVSLAADGTLQLATCADASRIGFVLGMLASGAPRGSQPAITRSGALTNPAWSFTLGPLYVGLAGALTQVEPTTGFSQVVGLAVSATRLLVSLGDPVAVPQGLASPSLLFASTLVNSVNGMAGPSVTLGAHDVGTLTTTEIEALVQQGEGAAEQIAVAGIALPAFAVVALASNGTVVLASSSDPMQFGYVLGIVPGGAVPGDVPEIISTGSLSNPAWSFNRGPIFVGDGGGLTQTEPTVGFSQQLGIAVSATRMLVGLQLPILP